MGGTRRIAPEFLAGEAKVRQRFISSPKSLASQNRRKIPLKNADGQF
jgi:hypothetical protein